MSKWRNHALTVRDNNRQIIADILKLYNGGEPIHLDPCYNKGAFWRDLPAPLLKSDKDPIVEGVERADVTALPHANHSIKSIMFDPPFVLKDTTRRVPNGLMEMAYTGVKSYPMLLELYQGALIEFKRVLVPKGLLVFKCQDVVSSGRQHWAHVDLLNMAIGTGFTAVDFFIRWRKSVLFSPNMIKQKHARKNHSFFWVFRS